MQFEPSQASEMLGPLLIEKSLSDVPLFGPDGVDIKTNAEEALKIHKSSSSLAVEDIEKGDALLPESFYQASAVAAKIRALRAFVRDELNSHDPANGVKPRVGDTKVLESQTSAMSLASDSLGSCREIHDALLTSLIEADGLPREAQCVIDHTILLRAKEKYLFDAVANRDIVADDPWVKFVWDWIACKLSTRDYTIIHTDEPQLPKTLQTTEV